MFFRVMLWLMLIFCVALCLTVVLVSGCSSGPSSTKTSSEEISSLDKRREFLEQYVGFGRTYLELDFSVWYPNNSGGLPGPNDWDIRLIATVPQDELPLWIPSKARIIRSVETSWLAEVPRGERAVRITEWYAASGRELVGIDREKSMVAYRFASMPFLNH